MKLFLSVLLIIISAYGVLSQTSSASSIQSNTAKKPKLKNFGSSLKKYENKQKKDSKNDAPDNPQDSETIRVKTNLVISDVLVVNQKGNIIAGLKSSDFIVSEDNVSQKIEVFAPDENASVSRSIVLIIDRSGSLYPYLKNSFDAAKILIAKLAPNDRMAIVTDDVKLVVPFTKDKTTLKNAIEKMKNEFLNRGDGLSLQYSALLAVLNEMFDDEDIHPIVIVQSDGDEVSMLKREPTDFPMPAEIRNKLLKFYGERAFGYQQLLETVRKSRATIYSIIPGIRLLGYSEPEQIERVGIGLKNWSRFLGNHNFGLKDQLKEQGESLRQLYLARQNSMFEIANLSGGYTDYIEKPEDAETVYSTVFTVIGNRYLIGYYSTNQEQNGKSRHVKIEVRDHPEYIVTGRKSYYAE